MDRGCDLSLSIELLWKTLPRYFPHELLGLVRTVPLGSFLSQMYACWTTHITIHATRADMTIVFVQHLLARAQKLSAWRFCKNCWYFTLIVFPMVRMQRQDSCSTCSGRPYLNCASFEVVPTNDYQNARVVDIGKIQLHQCPP